jgi:hypothetical protein
MFWDLFLAFEFYLVKIWYDSILAKSYLDHFGSQMSHKEFRSTALCLHPKVVAFDKSATVIE